MYTSFSSSKTRNSRSALLIFPQLLFPSCWTSWSSLMADRKTQTSGTLRFSSRGSRDVDQWGFLTSDAKDKTTVTERGSWCFAFYSHFYVQQLCCHSVDAVFYSFVEDLCLFVLFFTSLKPQVLWSVIYSRTLLDPLLHSCSLRGFHHFEVILTLFAALHNLVTLWLFIFLAVLPLSPSPL